MSVQASIFALIQAAVGGEIVRLDTTNSDGTARLLTLTNQTVDSRVVSLTDLGTPLTKTLWCANAAVAMGSQMTSPLVIVVLLDPHNVFDDDLSRSDFAAGSAPSLTIEVSSADDSSGTNEAVTGCYDLYREAPLIIPSCKMRSTVIAATQDKILYKIRARSNMVSGFGNIKVRTLMFG